LRKGLVKLAQEHVAGEKGVEVKEGILNELK
jgi:hypothetical protein